MADSPRRRPVNTRRATLKQRKQQHRLDTMVRVDFAAQQRKRWFLGAVSKLIIIAGVCGGLYYGGSFALTRLLFKNPDYNVAELNVETDGVLTPAAVIEASDLRQGVNIFKVDLGRAKTRIEAMPQVEEVQISRHLPHRISIQITERKPVAWIVPERSTATRDQLAASNQSFLIDSRGILLQPGKTLPQDFHLPIIRNYSAGPLTAGTEAEGEEIKSALDLLHAHQDSLIAARFQIQEIDLSRHYGLNVRGESGIEVMFGLDDMDKQLKRLDVYLQMLEPRGQHLGTINLLAQHNVPVTFITEPAVQEGPAGIPAATENASGDAAPTPAIVLKPTASSKEKGNTKSRGNNKSKTKERAHEGQAKSSTPHRKEPPSASARQALPAKSKLQPFTP